MKKIILADCLDALKDMESNSVDSIVTDPPYGLSFMGSGTTGIAALAQDFSFIGMERDSEYFEIAQKRLSHISKEVKQHKERVEERVALF